MLIHKSKLTLIAFGFLFSAQSQQPSPGTLTDTTFQPNYFFLKNSVFSQPGKKINGSIVPELKGIVSPFKKKESNLLNNYFNNSIGKPLDQLRKNIKGETDKYFKQPVVLVNAGLEYAGLSDSSYWPGGNTYYQGNFAMNSQWMVAGIPVSFNLDNQLFCGYR